MLKRIKGEKVRREAEGRKKRNERNGEKDISTRTSISLSHSFNKTFCKVQKLNRILSVSLKRWKEQGAESCNFHVYIQILRKNLTLPNTFIQYLEVQTQIKWRLWSSQLCRSPNRTRSSELRQRKKGTYNVGRVWVQGSIDRRDVYFNPPSFAGTKSCIKPIAGIWFRMPASPCPGLVAFLEATLSATAHLMGSYQAHLVRTCFPGLEDCGWTQQNGRGSDYCFQSCSAQEQMWLQLQ